ncbi:MAG: hypothetical protein K940chlam2_00086, partial [Chlamydiae bacterium]|nr:hypothetical protein [Chlamydiota bacterium]
MAIPSNLPTWESIHTAKASDLYQVRSLETYIELFLAHAPEIFSSPQLSSKLIHIINQNHLQPPQLEKIKSVFGDIIDISENKAHYRSDILQSTTFSKEEKLLDGCRYADLET